MTKRCMNLFSVNRSGVLRLSKCYSRPVQWFGREYKQLVAGGLPATGLRLRLRVKQMYQIPSGQSRTKRAHNAVSNR